MYENICSLCNPEATKKGDLKEQKGEQPSLYVGESSRSIKERSQEHWAAWGRREEKGHITKHQYLHHGGSQEPKFIMKMISSHKSALSRQISEAVRIRRRGGEGQILNSKGEFNCSQIPRLTLEKEEDEGVRARERAAQQENKSRELDHWLNDWELRKSSSREQERIKLANTLGRLGSTTSAKREQTEGADNKKRSKKLKYSRITENWGETVPPSLAGREKMILGELSSTLEEAVGHLGDHPVLDGQLEVEQGEDGHQTTLTPRNPQKPPPRTPDITGRLRQSSIVEYLPETPKMDYNTSTASLEDNAQYNQEIPRTEPAPSTKLNSKLEVQSDSLNTENCEFRRGGYCNTHQVQGTKYGRTEKNRVRGKDGIYKYKYSRKVGYRCIKKITKPTNNLSLEVRALSPNRDSAVAECGQNNGDLELSSKISLEQEGRGLEQTKNETESFSPD